MINMLVAIIITTCCLSLTRGDITGIQPRFPLKGRPVPPGSPMPMPVQWTHSNIILTLDQNHFDMTSNLASCDVIDYNFKLYRKYIFPDTRVEASEHLLPLNGLVLNIENGSCDDYPRFESNETYRIEVNRGKKLATVAANTVWGGLRGLETFSQLVWRFANDSYVINVTEISDWPRFAYRGLLLDTARHFIPTFLIKQNLDAMQWNKFNVFHWHLTDDQSFPFQSRTYPNLSKFGAFQPRFVYTEEDVVDIVEYARLRGIRVVPEIDSPGHTRAIGKAMPELLTPCYGDGHHPYTPNYPQHSEMEVLMVSNETVYVFMRNLLKDLRNVFKDQYIHLGMDEVYYACWESNPNVTQFMRDRKFQEYHQLEGYYANRLIRIAEELGYKYITYQEPVDNGVELSQDTLIQVWRDHNRFDSKALPYRDYMSSVASKGYRIILSACWYLNYIEFPVGWEKLYSCEPDDFEGSSEDKKLVVGGEAAMWTEFADETNVLSTMWPRASAVAERLWSQKDVNDVDNAKYRLDEMRCRIVRRGIPAQPIFPGYCSNHEDNSWWIIARIHEQWQSNRGGGSCSGAQSVHSVFRFT